MRLASKIVFGLVSLTSPLLGFENYFNEASITPFVGYRQDSLNWNIAGPHNKPDVLSELKWEDLRMVNVGAYAQATFLDHWYLCAEGDYAKILKGRTRDSDYDKNGRHGEVSRFNCNASRGEAFDISASTGYALNNLEVCLPVTIIPLVGYSYHEQHLQMYDGHIVLFDGSSLNYHIPELHSNYRTRWYGPLIGANFFYQSKYCLNFFLNAEYHWLTFHGKGHWNLRSEFYDDFQHKTFGNGFSGALGANYEWDCNWSLGVCASYYYFHGHKGRDRTFIKEDLLDSNDSYIGTDYIQMETRLNGVNWHSFRAEATLTYQY